MPTYQYRCTECGRDLEVVQKFSDPSLTECPTCTGTLRKVFNAVGVVFKGSGFYRNDSRAAAGGNGSSDSSKGDKTTESGGKADAADSKPAKTETTKTEVKKSDGQSEKNGGNKVGSGAGSSSTGSKAASS